MAFEIVPARTGSLLRVYIDYELPNGALTRWLGWLMASFYAGWCTYRMVDDT
jgi:hypothetical protein